jgi:hypothetical protein
MKVRTAHLGMLAFAGGHTLALLVTFLPDLTYIFGSVWTTVILVASIVAMVPFVVTEFVHGFREADEQWFEAETGFLFMAVVAFVLALFVVRPGQDATGWAQLLAYGLPAFVLCFAFVRYRDSAIHAARAAGG